MTGRLAIPVLGMAATALVACGGGTDDEVAKQAAAIVAAVEKTSLGPHAALCVAVLGPEGLDLSGDLSGGPPPAALLDALESAGWTAVPASTCGMPDDWNPSSGRPYTAMEDGGAALMVWVRERDPERPDRVAAGTLPWPMMEQEWDCAARQVEGEWVLENCEADTFN